MKTLFEGHRNAGLHKRVWDLKDEKGNWASSGVCFYRLTANGALGTRKMVLIR